MKNNIYKQRKISETKADKALSDLKQKLIHRYDCRRGIFRNSRDVLKIIALTAMVLDHIGVILARSYFGKTAPALKDVLAGLSSPDKDSLVYLCLLILRGIGRLSFPLFAFMIVEGVMFTHDIYMYIARLSIFAVISEVPFDLFLAGETVYRGRQNVIFTLLIGAVTVALIKKTEEIIAEHSATDRKGARKKSTNSMADQSASMGAVSFMKAAAGFFIACAGVLISYILKTDYSFYGIIIIYIFYIFRDRLDILCLYFLIITIFTSGMEKLASLDILLFASYDRDSLSSRSNFSKYFFYVFYPAHLLILYGVAEFII
ncbi:MAG: TraX family protein [Lachnospiraceae bacterium]|jgi:hypothetical protein|nr:TraX family protein [Lachnospiraceae bacterium]MEE3460396.1 TraX family protein [Lachnospiraceae bacterium]